MGTSNLTERSNTVFDSSWWNQLRAAFLGALVPRNGSGVPTASAGTLGTPALPWSDVYADRATIGGILLDPDIFAGRSHRIDSGKAKTSGYPEFLSAVGTGNGLTANLLATDTDLSLVIDGTALTLSADTTFGSLTAAPASQNTCLINEATWNDEVTTKLIGEHGGRYITIDNIGTGITALNGTIAAFKTGATEVFLARVDTTNNRLYQIYRGWAGTSRVTLDDNDTITLMKVSTLLINADGLTKVASTYYPESVGVAPAAGTAGKIYMERDNGRVGYDDGATISYDYMVLGWAVCDSADCVYVQPYDFDLQWQGTFKVGFDPLPSTTSQRVKAGSIVSVNGEDREFIGWDDVASTDLDAGESFSLTTNYFIYVKHDGAMVLSTVAPRPYSETLRGHYHPLNYYRCIGMTFASSASTFYHPAIPMEFEGTHDIYLDGTASSLSYRLPFACFLVGRRLRYNMKSSNTSSAINTIGTVDGLVNVGEWGATYQGLLSIRDFWEVFSTDGLNYEVGDFCASTAHSDTMSGFNGAAEAVTIDLVRRAGGRSYKGIVTASMGNWTPNGTKNGTTNPEIVTGLPSFFVPTDAFVTAMSWTSTVINETLMVLIESDGSVTWYSNERAWVNGDSYANVGGFHASYN